MNLIMNVICITHPRMKNLGPTIAYRPSNGCGKESVFHRYWEHLFHTEHCRRLRVLYRVYVIMAVTDWW